MINPEIEKLCVKLKEKLVTPMTYGEISKLLKISYKDTQTLILYASIHDTLAETSDDGRIKYFFI